MSTDKNLHRVAFRLTVYICIFFGIPAVILGGLSRFIGSDYLINLLFLFFLVGVYLSIRRTVIQTFPKEGIQTVRRDDVFVKAKSAVWAFTWGMAWRSFVIGYLTNWIVNGSGVNSNTGIGLTFVFTVAGWYFSGLWLVKYQYGNLKVVSADQPVFMNQQAGLSDKNGGLMSKFSNALGSGLGVLATAVFMLFPIGELYWIWMSFKIGSFWMFVLGLFPLTMIPTAIVGVYSLIFGMPDWVFRWFS